MRAKRQRGKVLRILHSSAPFAIADADDLYRLMQTAGESLTIYQLHDILRDLKQRDCIRYEQERNKREELPVLRWIRLEPRGRDIFEGTLTDPGIDLI